jgi:hypothetical protein
MPAHPVRERVMGLILWKRWTEHRIESIRDAGRMLAFGTDVGLDYERSAQ